MFSLCCYICATLENLLFGVLLRLLENMVIKNIQMKVLLSLEGRLLHTNRCRYQNLPMRMSGQIMCCLLLC